MLSEEELNLFKQYEVGITKKECNKVVLDSLVDKKLIKFNMNFIILTKEGKNVWDKVCGKNNVKKSSFSKKSGGKKKKDRLV